MIGRPFIIFAPCDARSAVIIGGRAIFVLIRRTGETRTAETALTIFQRRIFLSAKHRTGKCEWISSEVR